MSRANLALLLCAAVVAPSGLVTCATPRDPIDRVQPNYLDKATLAGEWYYQRTVIDMPAANGFTFIGANDLKGLSRITWDIQENFLYARRQTELIKNADGKGTIESNGGRYKGEVIAAFRVQKHFDIARPYNDTTGEELNVLTENAVDRPWYQRQFVRVNWSQNLVHNYDLDFESGSIESVPYYVQEFDPITGKRNPDAPYFDFDDGYFDVTTKLFAQGGTINYPGYGKFPLCWLDQMVECGSAEYTLRHSFKRVDPEYRYEPMPYKGKITDLFGFFWTDRLVYDVQSGVLEQSRERYLNRFNIWEQSYDADGNRIDPKDRIPKPIVYHVNRDWPTDDTALAGAAISIADAWNDVLVDVVKATGNANLGDQRMFILCEHNPVRAEDPAECGPEGTSPRIGDLRYSFIAYVPKFMTYGLLGFGPSNVDPETGEIKSGMVYLYHHNNIAAFRTQEAVELLNGTMSPTEYINGVDLTEWIEQTQHGAGASNTAGLEEARTMVDGITQGPGAAYWDPTRQPPSASDVAYMREHGTRRWLEPHLHDLHAQRTMLRADTDMSSGKLARLAGTEIESMLLNDEIYAGLGIDPTLPITDAAVGQASVVRGGFAQFAAEREKIRRRFAQKRNMFLPEMADDALMGMARELAEQQWDPSEVYAILRLATYSTVIAHELGHTLGLMHNFGGSDDALNYFDGYWELRAADGSVEPRVVDPITDDEVNNRIFDYAYSSVMDYSARYTLYHAGPGKYDRAAMLFGYAGKAEVFADSAGIPTEEFRAWHEDDGDVLMLDTDGPRSLHYTSFYNRMQSKLYESSNRLLVDIDTLTDDFSADTSGRARVPYIFCSHSRVDLGDHCLTRDFGADSYERMKNLLDEVDTWYITRNFPRGQIGKSQWNYVARNYDKIYGRIKHWHDGFGLYKELLPRFYTGEQLAEFYLDPKDGWGSKTWAVQNGFNKLIQTVLMPDVGSYAITTKPDGKTVHRKSSFDDATLNLGVSNGRFFSTSWENLDRECGYSWWECLHHVGFYLDKIMAIEALSDTRTNFVDRTTPADLRDWRIGYYSTFSQQIGQIGEAIITGDWSNVGPYMEGTELAFPNFAGALDEVRSGDDTIDPFATFSVQLYWQVLGMARFASNFDSSFAEQSRIFVMGTGQAPTIDRALVTYRDPISFLSFGAVRYRDQPAAGAALLDKANALLARSLYCDPRALTSDPADDCVEPGHGHTRESVTAMLADHNELIKAVVAVSSRMSLGDPYHPELQ